MTEDPSFKDREMTTIKVELNGKEYALKRYTIALEIEVQKKIAKIPAWRKSLQEEDIEVLIKTLFLFMEDTEDFKSWEDLAANLSGDPSVQINISEAISVCMFQAMPEMSEALKKTHGQARKNLKNTAKTLTTGRSSTIDSSKPTDGQDEKLTTAPITK